jgi:hypothetical protein
MPLLIPLVLLTPVIVGVLLLRNVSAWRKLVLMSVALVWMGLAFGLGFMLGEIGPRYRWNSAMHGVLKETNQALEDGQCDRVKSVYHEVYLLSKAYPGDDTRFVDAAESIGQNLRSQSAPHAP